MVMTQTTARHGSRAISGSGATCQRCDGGVRREEAAGPAPRGACIARTRGHGPSAGGLHSTSNLSQGLYIHDHREKTLHPFPCA